MIAGVAMMAVEKNYLPEGLDTAVLLTGLAGTAALSLYHHMYKSQDLQKVSQKVKETLEILNNQKTISA